MLCVLRKIGLEFLFPGYFYLITLAISFATIYNEEHGFAGHMPLVIANILYLLAVVGIYRGRQRQNTAA